MDLNGKTAVVTGGTRGIGRAIANSLLLANANVIIGSRSSADVEGVVAELKREHNARVAGAVCDVRDYEQVQSLFQSAISTFKTLDILINNAGIGLGESVEQTTPEQFRAVMETNLTGVFYCCHEAIPLMKRQGGGYIINISSLAGANPHPRMATYNASKFGLNGFSEALMQEVRHDNIKVSYIMPGSVNTEFGGDQPGDEKSWQLQPEDIAHVVMDLLSHPERSLPSRVEIRPSKPPRR